MNLSHCNRREDEILTKCEDFGGLAYDCTQIAEKLSGKIDEEQEVNKELCREIEQLKEQVESLESRISEMMEKS